ncbi:MULTISPECIES: TetR/AcrR family transcriptional regulator [Parafrankia]|uniref:TetR family transcriptional regulator n=1 Tax=Parafrankia soli TaxID=2599596 RepID=A0A1S1PV89_9ACTN|nr:MULTISPECIES: TetR family transcriptional regulator [Parafrankia]OHV24875.1 TetR family transcriptional regulator [Parafrankia soli]TCJ34785.1 TetR family transcriptional regulator [Parafrankia sp. BMG5.11]CAI7977219.1 Transcriptional regulator, TetR family [Frankia sp. Hr75.2]SQD98832.1 Transcriptional regulator, TetR family [Parafrankia sp. Ea1.12]
MASTAGRARGRYARTAGRRREIAQAVLDLVEEKGHAGVTTAEVARRAGTSEATVLYHYPSRDHLLVAALERDEELTVLQAERDGVRPAAGLAGLDLDVLGEHAQAAARRESLLRLRVALAGLAATPGHPAADYFARHRRVAIETYAGLVAERQRRGQAHPSLDPVEVARQVMATWEGLNAQWLLAPDFDLGATLVSAFRRLSGQNWMEAARAVLEPPTGI